MILTIAVITCYMAHLKSVGNFFEIRILQFIETEPLVILWQKA